MWNVECGIDRTLVVHEGQRRGSEPARSIPHSAFHIPHWGGGGGGAVRVGVDVGGTFTDLVALAADGRIDVRKVVTTPEDPAVGMFRALDELGTGDGGRGTGGGGGGPVSPPSSPVPIDVLVHGTTIATNTLLERTGARVALVTTRGFEDVLWLRRQDRAARRAGAGGRGRGTHGTRGSRRAA